MTGFIKRLSGRERVLGALVLGLAVAAIVAVTAKLAMSSLQAKDEAITQLEDELLNYTQRVKEGENVDKAFEQISQEHSSAWSQVEIHDRLRKEISRLSLQTLPPPGTDVATGGQATGPHLVDILTLPDGQLTESGKGYREYQIAFDIQPTAFQNLMIFLRRLQESPQALRIQAVDIRRLPDATTVSAHVTVTRIVVDGSPQGAKASVDSAIRNASFEQWDAVKKEFAEWRAQDCAVSLSKDHVVDGQYSLKADATGQAAAVYQEQVLASGKTYEVSLTLVTKGPVSLGAQNLATNAPFEGGQPVDTKGQPMRYRFRFTVPGAAGATLNVGAPYVHMEKAGDAVSMDAVSMREVGA